MSLDISLCMLKCNAKLKRSISGYYKEFASIPPSRDKEKTLAAFKRAEKCIAEFESEVYQFIKQAQHYLPRVSRKGRG